MENEEQLLENIDANLNAVEQKNNDEGKEMDSGSSIKKFKTVEALSKAYENLEKEFTKKCQRLNELLCDNSKTVLPQYKREDWLQKVGTFLENNERAKNYVKQIADILVKDEDLAKKDDALELAYSKVLKDNFKTKEEYIKDEKFLNEFVYNNEEIRKKIIEDYLINLNKNKTIPLINSDLGSLSMSSPKFSPKNLAEAGRYAVNILKK